MSSETEPEGDTGIISGSGATISAGGGWQPQEFLSPYVAEGKYST